MKKYTHLGEKEFGRLKQALRQGLGITQLAKITGRSTNVLAGVMRADSFKNYSLYRGGKSRATNGSEKAQTADYRLFKAVEDTNRKLDQLLNLMLGKVEVRQGLKANGKG